MEAWSLSRNARVLVSPPEARRGGSTAPLDGLRALSALWVVAVHTFMFMSLMITTLPEYLAWGTMYVSYAMRFPLNGSLGVDIFFVLSGYLIAAILRREFDALYHPSAATAATATAPSRPSLPTEPLLLRPADPAGPDAPQLVRPARVTWAQIWRVCARFYVRRLMRILPAYALALLVCYLVMNFVPSLTSSWDADQAALCERWWWTNLLFINNFYPGLLSSCMGWSWSVALEVQMYAVSPFLILHTVRYPRYATALLASLAAVSVALYMVLTSLVLLGVLGPYEEVVYEKPYARMFAYLFGMLAALRIEREEAEDALASAGTSGDEDGSNELAGLRLDARQQQRRRSSSTAAIVVPRVVASVTALAVAVLTTSSADVAETDAGFWTQMLLARPLFAVSMAYIVYDLLSARCAGDAYHRFVAAALGSRVLYVFAQLSYSVYLLHLTVIYALYTNGFLALLIADPPALVFDPRWMFPVFAVLFYAMASAGAVAVYFVIERPFINLSSSMFRAGAKH